MAICVAQHSLSLTQQMNADDHSMPVLPAGCHGTDGNKFYHVCPLSCAFVVWIHPTLVHMLWTAEMCTHGYLQHSNRHTAPNSPTTSY